MFTNLISSDKLQANLTGNIYVCLINKGLVGDNWQDGQACIRTCSENEWGRSSGYITALHNTFSRILYILNENIGCQYCFLSSPWKGFYLVGQWLAQPTPELLTLDSERRLLIPTLNNRGAGQAGRKAWGRFMPGQCNPNTS